MLKNMYSAPEAELLEIRIEENYLASPNTFTRDVNNETFIEDEEVELK